MSHIKTYTITFNCGRQEASPSVFASHLFSALENTQQAPELLILCLQEVAPLANSFLGGLHLQRYLVKYKNAVDIAASALDGASYVNIVSRNIGMTAIMVFVLRGQTKRVTSLETAEVGVGWWEMGNKGAVGVRMGYSTNDTSTQSLTFVSAHLAPMEWNCERRNEDWKSIVRRLVFEPISHNSLSKKKDHRLYSTASTTETTSLLSTTNPPRTGIYLPITQLILAGDLNYRTASASPTQTESFRFPQPSEDESYPQHFWHLLSSDQLAAEMKAGRTCHGMKEAPIDFPPTYKYSDTARRKIRTGEMKAEKMDETEGEKWDWSSHRWPSWCDRVLFLDAPPWMKDAEVVFKRYKALPLMATSDHRPVACLLEIPDVTIPEPTEEEGGEGRWRCKPPFSRDPYWKERRRAARAGEFVVGFAILLVTTWNILLVLVPLLFLLFYGLFPRQ